MSSEKKEKKQHKVNFNIKEKLKKTFSKEHLKEVFTGEEQKKHLKQGSYSSIMTVIVLAVIVVIPDSNRKRKDITGIRYCPV